MNQSFKSHFLERVRRDWRTRQTDNFDAYRFEHEMATIPRWKRLAIGLGVLRIRSLLRLRQILRHTAELEWLYRHLHDDRSREWLVSVMAYRVLGNKRVKLQSNNSERLQNIEMIERDLIKTRSAESLPNGQAFDDFDLHPLGIPILLRGKLGNVLYPFLLQQYKLKRGDCVIAANPGDVVIDAGGCYGDTALYFANAVGEAGTVYSYEFDAENLKIFHHNLLANEAIGGRIRLVDKALWSAPGGHVQVQSEGASTRVRSSPTDNTHAVATDSLDALVERNNIPKVHFIKMDIEGAELEALKGAKNTLLRDRPNLAICLYHRLQDFWQIPRFIDSLKCGYEFRIAHFSIHAEETVLFASVPTR